MAFVVSFSGSHGVGKTSLVNSIANKLSSSFKENVDYKILKEINTGLFNIGLALNGNGFDFDEIMFSQKQAFDLGYNVCKYYASKKNDNRIIFTDRCCVDTYMYTKYFVAKSPEFANKYVELLANMEAKSFEIIKDIHTILIAPFKDFEVLEDRMSMQSRDDIWQDFLNYFDALSLKCKVTSNQCVFHITNTQSTDQRCQEVLDILAPNLSIK